MTRDAIFARLRMARQIDSSANVSSPAHTIPSRARVSGEAAVSGFVKRLEAQGVCVETLRSTDDVPSAIFRFLSAARLPCRVRMGDDPILAALPWTEQSGLSQLSGAAHSDDMAAISVAVAGISETGTVVLASGPANPGTLAFLPDVHFVLMPLPQIVGSMEDAFAVIKEYNGNRGWPRTINFISGASRTGDIGGQLVMGAHGPRQLVVLLVADPL